MPLCASNPLRFVARLNFPKPVEAADIRFMALITLLFPMCEFIAAGRG